MEIAKHAEGDALLEAVFSRGALCRLPCVLQGSVWQSPLKRVNLLKPAIASSRATLLIRHFLDFAEALL
jgi:hypothetical protein